MLFMLHIALALRHLLLLLSVPALRSYTCGGWDVHSTVSAPASLIFLLLADLKGFLLASMMFTM